MPAREHTFQVITIPLQFTSVGILDAWAGELDPVNGIILHQLQDDSIRNRLTLLNLLQSISHVLIEVTRGNEGKLSLERREGLEALGLEVEYHDRVLYTRTYEMYQTHGTKGYYSSGRHEHPSG